MENVGLILEGGGMRGVFTAGVLDYFLERKINFNYIIAVSAGASNSISYVSRQYGRARTVDIDYVEKYHYVGLRSLLTTGKALNYDFLFSELPRSIYPIDYDTFIASDIRYITVATNCITGAPEYFEKQKTQKKITDVCRASCSLPILCDPVFIDGVPYLDGGIADSIPIRRSIADGNSKNVIVVTHEKGYRKPQKGIRLPFFMYRQYPLMKEMLELRNQCYNQTMDYVEQLEENGEALVIRPSKLFESGRLESNSAKLKEIYEDALSVTQSLCETNALQNFIENKEFLYYL